MNIKSIFDSFAASISELYSLQSAIRSNADSELKKLTEQKQEQANALESLPGLKERPWLSQTMYFYSAYDNFPRPFGYKSRKIDEMSDSVLIHKNKQYQWLLAEAYEYFEDFLEEAYAYAGLIDKNIWPLEDFGNATLNELDVKSYEWFLLKARKIKNQSSHITNQFRNKFPNINSIENSNKLKVNLKLALILVEQLRHIIVHKGGVVGNKDDFVKNIIKKSGLYHNGKFNVDCSNLINQYFEIEKYSNTVVLLEINIPEDIPINIHIDRLQAIVNYLIAYADIVTRTLHFHVTNKSAINTQPIAPGDTPQAARP